MLNHIILSWKVLFVGEWKFGDLDDVRDKMTRFREFYNFERIHGGIGHQSPYEYLLLKGTDMNTSSLLKSYLYSYSKIIN
jgi:hypothetical protein